MSKDPSHSRKKIQSYEIKILLHSKWNNQEKTLQNGSQFWLATLRIKGYYPEYIKKIEIKKSNNPINKWASEMSRLFSKDKI